MITSYRFDSQKPGKNILILGSIHGDEHCGTQAIEMLKDALVSQKISLQSGSITCMPYANFEAYHAYVRQIETNLNRVFATSGHSKEEKIAAYIKQAIDTHDFVLDLHSFSSGKEPFAFDDMPESTMVQKVLSNLPIEYIMTGWVDMYPENTEMDTIGYTKSQGKEGVIIECGKHNDSEAKHRAYSYILSVLETFNLIQKYQQNSISQIYIHVDTQYRKENISDTFVKNWQNFDPISKGEVIGYRADKSPVLAPYTGYMILPNAEVEVGGEWCYFGKQV